MLRGGRAHEPLSLETLRDEHPTETTRDVYVAVAALPRSQAFRVSGWPRWLVPGRFGLSRAVTQRPSEKDTTH